jgi:hypothetical protein
MTLDEAKALKAGDYVYTITGMVKWKVTGKPKIWKRDASRVKVPVKHGLYDHGYITEDNIKELMLPMVQS